jgi:hypothetical protein
MKHQTTRGEPLINGAPQLPRLVFAPAVADDVVRVTLERHARHLPPDPDIERVVQEEVGQQGRDDPALRRSPVPRDKIASFEHRGRFQPAFDVEEHPGAVGVLAHGPEQQLVIDAVEETLDVDVEHPVRAPAPLASCPDRVDRRSTGTITVGVGMEHGFQQRLQASSDHLLRDAVGDGRDPQRSRPAARLRYVHPANRRRHVAA